MRNFLTTAMLVALLASSPALAGPYSQALNDPTNPFDAPIPGFVGPDGEGKTGGGNYVNPEFLGWATGYVNYLPTPSASYLTDPVLALGPATANEFDVVVLGDLSAAEIDAGVSPGEITLTFDAAIRDGVGADFAVFENGFLTYPPAVMWAELAYVEVSSDGVRFARFNSTSLTPGPGMELDATDVFNLAGKHVNWGVSWWGIGDSWGTPFDLGGLAGHDLVSEGLLDLQAVTHVRLVDIPGRGDFLDANGASIYDPWPTGGTGGLDLEALGVLNEMPDFDGDGDVDGDDLDILRFWINLGTDDLHYDLDNDGDADPDDLNYMIANDLQWVNGASAGYGTVGGDFYLDGVVDNTDLTRLAANYGLSARWADGNANFDNTIDNTDLTILATNYGYTAPGLDAVPEPASLSLLAAGALALGRRRRA